MNNQQSRRGETQAVAHKTKNNTYRLGVSPTGVASENENVQRNARKLSGLHPTYKGYSVPSSSCSVSMRDIGAAPHGFTARTLTPQGRYAGYSGSRGFTLIELLVVVLIIGFLAAVAVPQYQRAVEKARMAEAVANVRAIASAHQLYYLTHGTYLSSSQMNKLDITIPGTINTTFGSGRIQTKDFIYSPNVTDASGKDGKILAVAQRVARAGANPDVYSISIKQSNPDKITCTVYVTGSASTIQKELCKQLNATGTL